MCCSSWSSSPCYSTRAGATTRPRARRRRARRSTRPASAGELRAEGRSRAREARRRVDRAAARAGGRRGRRGQAVRRARRARARTTSRSRGEGVAGKPEGELVARQGRRRRQGRHGVAPDRPGDQRDRPARRGRVHLRFNDFVNQVDYARRRHRAEQRGQGEGAQGPRSRDTRGQDASTFLGAFTFLAPNVVTITPAQLEVGA